VPLVGLVPEDNIREGTSYKYFATELIVFVGLSMAAPRQFLDTWTGRVLLAVHLPLHIGLVIGDYVAHEEVVKKALYKRQEDPLQWFSSKMGLAVDVACHAVATGLLSTGIVEWTEWWVILLVYPLGLLFYVLTNQKYFFPSRGAGTTPAFADEGASSR